MGKPEILVETVVGDIKIHSTEGDRLVVRGIFGVCDKKTNNGRVYPRSILEREIKKAQSKIADGLLYGECEHPMNAKTELPRVSHRITKLALTDDGYVVGEAIVLNTPAGNIVKEILLTGGKVGVSSRGIGSLAPLEDGSYLVQEDYNLITYDFVANPAVDAALISEYDWVKINEALEYEVDNKAPESLDNEIQLVLNEAESGSATQGVVVDDKVRAIFEYLGLSKSLSNVDVSLSVLSDNFNKLFEEVKQIQFNDDSLAEGIIALLSRTKEISEKLNEENNRKIERLKKVNSRLVSENRRLSKQNDELIRENERLLRENEELRRELAKYGEMAEQLKDDYAALQQKLENLINESRAVEENYRVKLLESENFVRWALSRVLYELGEESDFYLNNELNYQVLKNVFDRYINLRKETVKEDDIKFLSESLEEIYSYVDKRFSDLEQKFLAFQKIFEKRFGELIDRIETSSEGRARLGESSLERKGHLRGIKRIIEERGALQPTEKAPITESSSDYGVIEGLTPEETEIILKLAGVYNKKSSR